MPPGAGRSDRPDGFAPSHAMTFPFPFGTGTMSNRGTFFRKSHRSNSYKPSEVLGLFIVSMGLGMGVYFIALALDRTISLIFGTT
jgi:hypothetical protein